MPLYIRKGDIAESTADAVVRLSLPGGSGENAALRRAAGPELREADAALGACRPGEARITAGYRLPAKTVIHTVGPVWQGGGAGERDVFASCCRAALDLAEEAGCSSVAFPLIAAGPNGVPAAEALETAVGAISAWLAERDPDMRVDLMLRENLLRGRYRDLGRILGRLPLRPDSVLYGAQSFAASASLPADSFCAAPNAPSPETEKTARRGISFFRRGDKKKRPAAGAFRRKEEAAPEETPLEEAFPADAFREDADVPVPPAAGAAEAAPRPPSFDDTLSFGKAGSLADAVAMVDESFSEMLLRKIDERGMKDAECYRRANVDRKLFSKIRSDPHYRPSKPTAIAFAVALELPMEETEELLLKAGYALSPSTAFDVIIRWFIERRIYNLFEINEALFAFDQNQLGA